jgi:hypothetical protein
MSELFGVPAALLPKLCDAEAGWRDRSYARLR